MRPITRPVSGGSLSRGCPCMAWFDAVVQSKRLALPLSPFERGTRICDLTRATVRLALSPDMLAPKLMLHTALVDMSITPRARVHRLPHAARTTSYHNQPRTRLMHSTMRSSRRVAFAGGPLYGFGFGQGLAVVMRRPSVQQCALVALKSRATCSCRRPSRGAPPWRARSQDSPWHTTASPPSL